MRVHDELIAARHLAGQARAPCLARADLALDQLRQYGHLAWSWGWWSGGQFEHFSKLCEPLGRLIGGWRRSLAQRAEQG